MRSLARLLPLAVALSALAETPIPPDHHTLGELTAFRSAPSLDEVRAFALRLTATSPYLRLETFGESGQGRRLPLIVVSKEKAFAPEEAWKSGKPVVLVISSIHGGELDGTEASLILLRDLALGNLPEILDGLTLLVVPVYNVDGFERRSRFARPNQDGPADGMGFRTNAMGLDLNRDFMKADAGETRALLALAARWRPDLFVDNHVTDGIDWQPMITAAWGSEPATSAPLMAFLSRVVPRALAKVEEDGFVTWPFADPRDALDPAKGFESGYYAPRYATGYFPLRQVPSVLVETHAIKPYERRVRANERFLRALLSRVAAERDALRSAREKARSDARRAPVGALVVLDAETDLSRSSPRKLPTYAWTVDVSPVSGAPVTRYDRTRPLVLEVPFFAELKPKVTVRRPAGYLVEPGWPGIEERLLAHGIRTVRLPSSRAVKVGTYRVEDARPAQSSYQGRVRMSGRIVGGSETRTLPAGSLWVPLDTELAPVILALLEPEAPDSLFAWGELSSALEAKEYIDLRVLDPLAEKMLESDPQLQALWKEKLKDPAFAADRRQRARFFYSRTPYWDESQGLLPIYRVEEPLVLEAAPARDAP